MKTKTKTSPANQVASFRKAARDLGCDESEERFQDVLRTVAKAKKPPSKKSSKSRDK